MQTSIHRLIQDQGIVLMPGCYDALSAATIKKTGFSAGFISGYALSAVLLGKSDHVGSNINYLIFFYVIFSKFLIDTCFL